MVEIEESRLGPFQQNVVAGFERFMNESHGVGNVGRQPRGAVAQVHIENVVGVHLGLIEHLGKDLVGVSERNVELGFEHLLVE